MELGWRLQLAVVVVMWVVVVVMVLLLTVVMSRGRYGHGQLRRLRRMVIVVHSLSGHQLPREFRDERQRLEPLVYHQAHGALLDHLLEHVQVLQLHVLLLGRAKVVLQIVLQLGALLVDVGEVDEEPRAHVPFQPLDAVAVVVGRVVAQQQVAVLKQSAAPDLLRVPRHDQLVLQMEHGVAEVAVHRLADHGRVEALADRHAAGTLVEQQQRVEHDLERVDGELERPLHFVHKLELDVPLTGQRAQRDERPPVAVFVHLHHFADVRLLDAARRHPLAAHAFRQQVHQRLENGRLDAVKVPVAA